MKRFHLALVPLALAASSSGDVAGMQGAAFDPARLMADVQTYYEFGVHRTAYPGDLETSDWLGRRFRALGIDTSEHTFALDQFFLDEASIEDATGRIAAFPIWLPRATPRDGVTARLTLVDDATPSSQIRGTIAWLQPANGSVAEQGALGRKATEAGAAAIIFATTDRGDRGLFQAVNAEREYVDAQRQVPTLTFGSVETARLRRSLGRDVTVRLTGRIIEGSEATSVLGRRVIDEDADWIVVSTPSSGWFTSAGERGPGIAMLLALAEWVGTRPDGLNFLFVATSGHELDFLGARLLHEAHLAPPPERTRAWVHLGAQIATPEWEDSGGGFRPTDRVTNGTLQASPEFAAILAGAFGDLPMYTLRTDTRLGEFRDLVEHGYRGLGIVGGSNPWFHVPGDDPRGVHPETLAQVTQAMAIAIQGVERFTP